VNKSSRGRRRRAHPRVDQCMARALAVLLLASRASGLLLQAPLSVAPPAVRSERWRVAVRSSSACAVRSSRLSMVESTKVLDTSTVADMLEASFVRACMDLAKGLVDTLKLFIVAAKAGFEIGSTISEVSSELEACERQTAGRPLMPEELELRHLWYCLVYQTLAFVDHPTKVADVGETVGAELREKYAPLVEGVVVAHVQGRALQSLELSEFLQPVPSDAVEKAVLSQSMRLIFLTLVVLKEEGEGIPIKPAGGPPTKRGYDGPPQPYIPGTS
jgi:hypothetical protein